VLDIRLEFDTARDTEIFAQLPTVPGVFTLRPDGNADPYISKTANLRRRLQRLLGAPNEHSKRLNLRQQMRWIEYRPTGSDFESGFLLYQKLREAFPKSYRDRMRFRFAPLVKLHLDNPYPRASVTTRMGRGPSLYYGPFPTRTMAENFANDALDFFKMRRCVDDLKPDPAFPGCMYSEMKMCLAPCFRGCSDEAYAHEVERVRSFLDSRGESLVHEISGQRDQASSNLEFENAAALHARLEKLAQVVGTLPELIHRIDQLRGVLVQPSAKERVVCLFPIQRGRICDAVEFSVQEQEQGRPQSMESRVESALASQPIVKTGNMLRTMLETMEHLALLKRWYYRTSRTGEIFFTDPKGALPMRRLVRGIGRVYHREQAPPSPVAPAPVQSMADSLYTPERSTS
jgi:excinuclease UvrABC nuclease subunit